MRSMISFALAACAVVAISSQALAQAPAPAPESGNAPEQNSGYNRNNAN